MFLHLSVSLSVHRGVCLSACWDTTTTPQTRHPPWEQTPPRADSLLEQTHPPEQTPPQEQTPPTPWVDTPPGADTPLEQIPPWEQTPPQSRHTPGADTPPTGSRDGYWCGPYTSYWNAFLCMYVFTFWNVLSERGHKEKHDIELVLIYLQHLSFWVCTMSVRNGRRQT